MADTAIAITAGSGTNVDTRTESTNGNHRQVVVIGDPATNAGVAPVDATNGLAVDVKALPASTNTIEVVGDAAENAAVAGNPVLAGGRYDSSDRTLDNGDVGALAVNAKGILKVQSTDTNGDPVSAVPQAVFTPRSVTVNFTSNTDVHASGDVVADTEVITEATPANDVECVLTSLTVVNIADTAVDLRFHFFKSNVSLGTENSAVTLSAANAVNHLGYVDVVAADYADLVNSQVATIKGINLGLTPASGTNDVYCAIEARGAVDLVNTTDLHVTFTFL